MIVKVLNVKPSVDAGPDVIVQKGEVFSQSAKILNPGLDTYRGYADFGDGSPKSTYSLTESQTAFNIGRTYATPGDYTVTVSVTEPGESAGTTGTDTVRVKVRDFILRLDISGQVVNEGDTLNQTVTVQGPTGKIASAKVDYGDGSPLADLTVRSDSNDLVLSHRYVSPAICQAKVMVTDIEGYVLSCKFKVEVKNVVPAIAFLQGGRTQPNVPFSAAGSFTHPAVDSVVVTVDYGDGGGYVPVTQTGNDFKLLKTYATAGTYAVKVRAADHHGGTGQASFVVEVYIPRYVTYDANGGTGTVPVDSTPYKTGDTVTALFDPLPIRTSYLFAGWNTKVDGTGTNYSLYGVVTFTMGAQDVTLYAKWDTSP